MTTETDDISFPQHFDIDDVVEKITTRTIENNPRLRCSHTYILEQGKNSYKVATSLEIVDEHTGELHHYAIEIHNIHKYSKKGWVYKEIYRINNLEVFNGLYEFLTQIKDKKLGPQNNEVFLIGKEDFNLLQGIKKSDNQVLKEMLLDKNKYSSLGE